MAIRLLTGVPGASKTAFAVTDIKKISEDNIRNLIRNVHNYKSISHLVEKYSEDFTYLELDRGVGAEFERVYHVLDHDYFDFLKNTDIEQLPPDFYFQRITQFNDIINRINLREDNPFKLSLYPVRTIYANISGLKIPNVRPLIYDWRDAPDGSMFFIDEVQLVEPYSDLKSKDDMIMNLTTHRHRGMDFTFITQFPALLHPTVKVLVAPHLHITRPFGMKPVIIQWGVAKDQPNAMINRLNIETKFSWKPDPKIFKLYKSTTINTHKPRYPRALIIFAILIIGALAVFVNSISGGNTYIGNLLGISPDPTNTANADKKKDSLVSNPYDDPASDLSASSSPATGDTVQNFDYSPSDPYRDLSKQVTYEPQTKPYFSGCAKFGKKYVAYTQQGTILDGVSDADCKRLIDSGHRPFNYFTQSPAPSPIISASDDSTNIHSDGMVSNIVNNQVQPHLQQSPINGANPL